MKSYYDRMLETRWAENKEKKLKEETKKKQETGNNMITIGKVKVSKDLPVKLCHAHGTGEIPRTINNRCLHATARFSFKGVTVPRNAIIYITKSNEWILCKKFPNNYKGKNPTLEVWRYDRLRDIWESEDERNATTMLIYKAWVDGGMKSTNKLTIKEQVEDGHAKFDPVIRKKHQHGVRIFHEDKIITDYETIGKRGSKITSERYWHEGGLCYNDGNLQFR